MSFPTQSAMLGSTKFVDMALDIAGMVDQDSAIMRDVDNRDVQSWPLDAVGRARRLVT
jgi:hypothetical protein